MYAKVKDSILIKYPYDFSDLYAENPYTNYSGVSDLSATFAQTESAIANGYTLEEVAMQSAPTIDSRVEKIEQQAPLLIDGIWTIGWNVIPKSAQEIADDTAAKSTAVRADRKNRLSACDWTQLADAPGDKAAWASYRQALRDVPSQEGFPWAITWPEEP